MPTRPLRRGLPVALVAAALLLAGCAASDADTSGDSTASSAATSSDPATPSPEQTGPRPKTVTERSPEVTELGITGKDRTEVFNVTFPVEQSGDTHVVRSLLVAKEVTNRLYLGQELVCTGPSGQEWTGIQTGRNVVPDEDRQVVISHFLLEADEAGDWNCISSVRVCEPGQCSTANGSGDIILALEGETGDRLPTQFTVSAPLPEWSTNARAGEDAVIIQSGESGTMTTTFEDIPLDEGPMQFVGVISLSNCIEPDYPSECRKVKTTALQEDSIVDPVFTFTQKGGADCPVVTATEDQGAEERNITWQQHHGAFWFIVPNVELSPDCDPTVQVDLTFTAKKGNGIVLERGTSSRPTAVVFMVPTRQEWLT